MIEERHSDNNEVVQVHPKDQIAIELRRRLEAEGSSPRDVMGNLIINGTKIDNYYLPGKDILNNPELFMPKVFKSSGDLPRELLKLNRFSRSRFGVEMLRLGLDFAVKSRGSKSSGIESQFLVPYLRTNLDGQIDSNRSWIIILSRTQVDMLKKTIERSE